MKIGIDARLYNETGVGRYIRNLIFNLNKIDRENNYVIFAKEKDFNKLPKNPKWIFENTNIKWHSIEEQIQFIILLLKHKVDLMHFPYYSLPIFYPGKFVVTIHDLTILNFPTGKASTLPAKIYKLKWLGYRIVLAVSLLRAKKIIVPSNSTANSILKLYPWIKNKIIVTYEGGMKYYPISKVNYKFKPFILYVGNVYPHKNIERAIFALSSYNKKTKSKLNIVIVCKEDFFLTRLREFVNSKDISQNIFFLTDVDDQELSKLYQNAEFLIYPSVSEGFGLPLVEAMQNGCLIACSNIQVFIEVAQDLPFYFDPNNESEIENTMNQIVKISKSKKQNVVLREIERAKYFSWEKMARETLKVYNDASR